jgi:hypothetical protein
MLNWPNKDPDEVLDYSVNWASRLVSLESISSHTVSVISGSVTINSSSHTADVVSLWLSAGTSGEQCKILCRIITNQGRVMDQTVGLRIKTS